MYSTFAFENPKTHFLLHGLPQNQCDWTSGKEDIHKQRFDSKMLKLSKLFIIELRKKFRKQQMLILLLLKS